MLVSSAYIGEDPYGLVSQRHQDNMADHIAPEDIYPQKNEISLDVIEN